MFHHIYHVWVWATDRQFFRFDNNQKKKKSYLCLIIVLGACLARQCFKQQFLMHRRLRLTIPTFGWGNTTLHTKQLQCTLLIPNEEVCVRIDVCGKEPVLGPRPHSFW